MEREVLSIDALTFEKLTLPDKDRLEKIRGISGNSVYTYTFPTLFSWQEEEDYSVCFSDSAFLVKNGARGANAYLAPCGTEDGVCSMMNALFESGSFELSFVSDTDKALLENRFPGRIRFEECRNDFPYLYDRLAQVELAGKQYKKLRHKINHGKDSYNWEIEEISESNFRSAIEINRVWQSATDTQTTDCPAADRALENFRALDMCGFLFRADGKDAGYVLGSFINSSTFDINFCKMLIPETDCYIKWETYRLLPDSVTTVDCEEDMGLEGLRLHKMQRLPKKLETMWKGSFVK